MIIWSIYDADDKTVKMWFEEDPPKYSDKGGKLILEFSEEQWDTMRETFHRIEDGYTDG